MRPLIPRYPSATTKTRLDSCLAAFIWDDVNLIRITTLRRSPYKVFPVRNYIQKSWFTNDPSTMIPKSNSSCKITSITIIKKNRWDSGYQYSCVPTDGYPHYECKFFNDTKLIKIRPIINRLLTRFWYFLHIACTRCFHLTFKMSFDQDPQYNLCN